MPFKSIVKSVTRSIKTGVKSVGQGAKALTTGDLEAAAQGFGAGALSLYAPIVVGKALYQGVTSQGAKDMVSTALGGETSEDKAKRKAAEAIAAERDAVQSILGTIGSDKALDSITRGELQRAAAQGANSSQLSARYRAAMEGKGIFAVRQSYDSTRRTMSMAPGRAQTVLSLGYGSRLG